MKRSLFLKALVGLPFGGVLARQFQAESGKPEYLLNKFFVAGFQYYKGPAVINELAEGEFMEMEAVPDNEYDRFAVKIFKDDIMLGHVPRTDNKHISRLLRQQVSLFCKIAEVNPQRETWEMLKVEVWL